MKNLGILLTIITLIFSILYFSNDEISAQEKIMSTKGIISIVNESDNSIIIKHHSRAIKFKADTSICKTYKNMINKIAIIYYIKTKDGSLFIKDIKIQDN